MANAANCLQPSPLFRSPPPLERGLMNAEHESRASSLRALNPLLTPRQARTVIMTGGQRERERRGGEEATAETMENVLNYKICKNDKANASKKKACPTLSLSLFNTLSSFSPLIIYLSLSLALSLTLHCVCRCWTITLINHRQKLTNGAFEVFSLSSPLPLLCLSLENWIALANFEWDIPKFRNANEARENVKFTRRVKRNRCQLNE